MPRTAIQASRDFASAILDERHLHTIADLINQLNQDLAAINNRPQIMAIDGSAP